MTTSPVFTADIAPSCCMRRNPTAKETFQEDLKVFSATACVYVACALSGYQGATLGSAACLVMILFSVCVGFHEIYIRRKVVEVRDSEDTLSQKQKEHGASLSRPNFEEDENHALYQLRMIERDTQTRNAMRAVTLSTTPSSTNLANDENPRVNSNNVYFSNNHYLHGYTDSD